jgi:hypothetical protein
MTGDHPGERIAVRVCAVQGEASQQAFPVDGVELS